jgi:copper transport protein
LNVKKCGSLLMLILFSLQLFFPSFVSAHAYIMKSSPYENETLSKSPKKVTIQFDEKIQSSFKSLKVFDSKGKRADKKNSHIDPSRPSVLTCDLKANLPKGTYRIQWRVVSSDGHPVEGVIPFQVGKGSEKVKKTEKGYMPQLDLIIIRWIQYISNACLVGVLFVYLVILHKDLAVQSFRLLIKYSLIVLGFSILVNLPLQGRIESGVSWAQILDTQKLKHVLSATNFGKAWIVQIDCLAVLFVALRFIFIKRWVAWIAFMAGTGLLLAKAFTSHAATSAHVFLAISIDFIHLLAASIWIGSLIGLAALIPLKSEIFTVVRRFSKWGIILVLVLMVTGILGSLSYIPTLPSLFATGYGRVLSGKIILLLLMIVLAAVNFFKGKREARLRSTLWGEIITGFIVLVLSVLLTNLPTAMSSPGPIKATHTVEQGKTVTFEATPNVIGLNTFTLSLKDKNGGPLRDVQQVTLTFTSLEMSMGDETKTLVKAKDGVYRAKGMNFNMAGRWKVRAHVLTKDLESLDTNFKVMVGSQ